MRWYVFNFKIKQCSCSLFLFYHFPTEKKTYQGKISHYNITGDKGGGVGLCERQTERHKQTNQKAECCLQLIRLMQTILLISLSPLDLLFKIQPKSTTK